MTHTHAAQQSPDSRSSHHGPLAPPSTRSFVPFRHATVPVHRERPRLPHIVADGEEFDHAQVPDGRLSVGHADPSGYSTPAMSNPPTNTGRKPQEDRPRLLRRAGYLRHSPLAQGALPRRASSSPSRPSWARAMNSKASRTRPARAAPTRSSSRTCARSSPSSTASPCCGPTRSTSRTTCWAPRIARPLIAKHQVEVAQPDRRRRRRPRRHRQGQRPGPLRADLHGPGPDLKIIAPWKDPSLRAARPREPPSTTPRSTRHPHRASPRRRSTPRTATSGTSATRAPRSSTPTRSPTGRPA